MAKKPTAKDVAKWMLSHVDREAGDAITHLKLQKLVYYAQAWHLAHFGEEIFAEDLKAWAHGPVAPSVWHEYKCYRWDSIPSADNVPEFNKKTSGLLSSVYDAYGRYSAKQLERLTHDEEPWKEARGNLPPEAACDTPISKKTMADFYRARISNGQSAN